MINIDWNEKQYFSYNTKTSKLTRRDGTEDEFCKIYNWEYDKIEITKGENRILGQLRGGIEDCARPSGAIDYSKENIDIEYSVVDFFKSAIKVGDRTFTCGFIPPLLDFINQNASAEPADYTYNDDLEYDNGVSLIDGKKFVVNGADCIIGKNHVIIKDTEGSSIKGNHSEYPLEFLMDMLIRLANGQMVSGWYTDKDIFKDIKEMLNQMGINTDKEFVINGKTMSLVDDKLEISEETKYPQYQEFAMTDRQIERAIKKYEAYYEENMILTKENGNFFVYD